MNEAGFKLLRAFEGWSPIAYPDPASGGDPWTIGYGFTKGVRPGDRMTFDEGQKRLELEVKGYEAGVRAMTPSGTENQIAAMTSLAFNIGLKNFMHSSVVRFHNEHDYANAADSFLMWRLAAGKVMPGLLRRRQAERLLYLTEDK